MAVNSCIRIVVLPTTRPPSEPRMIEGCSVVAGLGTRVSKEKVLPPRITPLLATETWVPFRVVC